MTNTKKQTTANRGMKFEEQIQKQCDKYKKRELAYIDKLPTAWKVIRKGKYIVSAFPEAKSKLDFYGTLYNGDSVYIEAKSTQENSLPLSNFKEHQFLYLEELSTYTSHVYVIIEMKKHKSVFLVKGSDILDFKETSTRKSIPLSWLKENGEIIEDFDFLSKILKKQ